MMSLLDILACAFGGTLVLAIVVSGMMGSRPAVERTPFIAFRGMVEVNSRADEVRLKFKARRGADETALGNCKAVQDAGLVSSAADHCRMVAGTGTREGGSTASDIAALSITLRDPVPGDFELCLYAASLGQAQDPKLTLDAIGPGVLGQISSTESSQRVLVCKATVPSSQAASWQVSCSPNSAPRNQCW